jgi:hypothetical protein
MIRILFINEWGERAVRDLAGVPAIGHRVLVFPERTEDEVTNVVWMPEVKIPVLKGKDIDVMITIG